MCYVSAYLVQFIFKISCLLKILYFNLNYFIEIASLSPITTALKKETTQKATHDTFYIHKAMKWPLSSPRQPWSVWLSIN
jgi:hypothetical protein